MGLQGCFPESAHPLVRGRTRRVVGAGLAPGVQGKRMNDKQHLTAKARRRKGPQRTARMGETAGFWAR
jgi:hypothetical protein